MVIFPGGYGTLDELFELLTLMQTGKTREYPVVLVGGDDWRGLRDWLRDTVLAEGRIDAEPIWSCSRSATTPRRSWRSSGSPQGASSGSSVLLREKLRRARIACRRALPSPLSSARSGSLAAGRGIRREPPSTPSPPVASIVPRRAHEDRQHNAPPWRRARATGARAGAGSAGAAAGACGATSGTGSGSGASSGSGSASGCHRWIAPVGVEARAGVGDRLAAQPADRGRVGGEHAGSTVSRRPTDACAPERQREQQLGHVLVGRAERRRPAQQPQESLLGGLRGSLDRSDGGEGGREDLRRVRVVQAHEGSAVAARSTPGQFSVPRQ